MQLLRPVSLAVLSAAGLCLTACAGGQNPAPAMTAHPGSVCITEKPIGSHMPRRTCRTDEQVKADRRTAHDTIETIGSSPAVPAEQH